MMTTKTTSIVTAGTFALAIATTAYAFGHRAQAGGRGCGEGMWGGARILHGLDLTADQKQQVQDIVAKHRPALGPLMASERAAKSALADSLFATTPATPQQVDTLVKQEADARTALERERLALALEVRNVLTPAQIQNGATIRAKMKDLHTQMRQLFGKQQADG
jgi:Spy/CpxP family protein refolding chaperone